MQNPLSDYMKTLKPLPSKEEYDKGIQARPSYLQHALKKHFDVWIGRERA